MLRKRSVLLHCLFCLLLAGCASAPPKTDPPLERREGYSEHRIQNHQGLQLFVRRWDPAAAPKANVVILHGTALHSGLYEPVAQRLTAAGYRVYAYDMQGWGRSSGFGAAGFVTHFYDYADDLMVLLDTIKRNNPGVPNFVMGESLGGTVALYAALKDRTLCDGIITSAAGYKPNPKLLGVRAPGFVASMGLSMAQLGGAVLPEMPAVESDTGIRLVVEDDAVEEQLLQDPYVAHGWLPTAYASTLADAMDYIEPNLKELDKPILLLHGERDMLVPLSSSYEIYRTVASTEKDIRVYKSPHTVLLEGARDQAVDDVILFLDRNTAARVAAQ
ncbi:MAG TPA: alpha/beta fold hydrolase [Dongiaceae bacterium]|nr:alpha/beta fold hydrolase [Dongiaceae bacterium]